MAAPPDEPTGQQDVEEKQRQQKLAEAYALFEKHPELASVLVQIHDQEQTLEQELSLPAKERLSEARLEHCLKRLDVYGRAYLRLVTDFESAKAHGVLVSECLRAMWGAFSGLPMDAVQPTPPFAEAPTIFRQRDRLVNRAIHWEVEGFRRVATRAKNESELVPNEVRTQRKALNPRPELLANLETTLSRLRAAEALGVTTRTLDRWVGEKKLMPTGLGVRKRFRTKDLKRILDERILDKRDTE